MNFIKIILAVTILSIYSSSSLSETKKDCSKIKADTGVKMYEKWKCQKEIVGKNSLGKKIKTFFKKKN